jgi:hypothetical protein
MDDWSTIPNHRNAVSEPAPNHQSTLNTPTACQPQPAASSAPHTALIGPCHQLGA